MLGDTKSLGSLLQAVSYTQALPPSPRCYGSTGPPPLPSMLLCVSEGSKAPPAAPREDQVWISTPSGLSGSHSFHPCCLPGSAGWLGLGPWANISPRVQFLPLFPSLVHWLVSSYPGLCSCSDLSFNQNESWCWILFVPGENSRGHLYAVVLGAFAGGLSQEKRELRMFLREISAATKPEAAPGFTTGAVT